MGKEKSGITEQSFEHADNCGHCEYGRVLVREEFYEQRDRTREEYAELHARIEAAWHQTKYMIFYKECIAANLDWQAEKRG